MKQQHTLQPKVRFPEFKGDWKLYRLENLFEQFKSGNTITSKSIFDEGNYPVFGGNGLRGYSDKYTHEGKFFLIGRQGALCGNINRFEGKAFVSEHAIVCISNRDNNTDFLSQRLDYLNLNRLSESSAQPGLAVNKLLRLKLVVPSLPEQQKIADYLSTIDTKINLLEEKKAQLALYKKAMMQKLFSQEIRFKDENGNDFGEWEEKKIEDVFIITRGYVLAVSKMKNISDNNFKFPVYSSQTRDNGLTGFYNEYLYEDAITWTTDGANAGTVLFRKGKFYCTNVCGVLISNNGNSNNCIAEMINKIAKKYVSYVGNPKLMNNVMAKIKIYFPTVPEQQKIADFLSAIDESIEKVNEQITQTQSFKKAMLQGMFV